MQLTKHNATNRPYSFWSDYVLSLMLCFYSLYFFSRANFPYATPLLESELKFDKETIGLILTIWSFAHSIGRLLNGFISEYFHPRKLMAFGLLLSGICNLLLAYSYSFTSFAILWGLCGLFQSIGWPQCVKLMSFWYKANELGTKWAIASLANQIGSCAVFLLFGVFLTNSPWDYFFFIPGVIAIFVSVIIYFSNLYLPQELGFKSAMHSYSNEDKNPIDHHLPLKEIFIKHIIFNRMLWYICFANFFLYIVKSGFTVWGFMYLREEKSVSLELAGINMAVFEIAGAIGGITAGIMSDKVFSGRRGPVGAIYMAGILFFITYLYFVPVNAKYLNLFIMFCLGFVFFGPQIMTGAASIDFSSKQSAIFANAIVGFFAHFGSSLVSGVFMGYIAKNYGWSYAFGLIIFSAICSGLLFLLTAAHKKAIANN